MMYRPLTDHRLPHTQEDWSGLAWLTEMAGRYCIETGKSKWGSQLLADAAIFRDKAAEAPE